MAHQDREPTPNNNAAQETGAREEAGRDPTGTTDTTDRDQPGALGGDVATRSGTAPTPPDEQAGD